VWTQTKFTMTIDIPSDAADTLFNFYISAKGTFYIDCGTGGVLSGTGVSGKVLNRASNSSNTLYTCTYDTAGAKTIRFGGVATEYNGASAAIQFFTGTDDGTNGAVSVEGTEVYITTISGSLSDLFPTIGAGNTYNTQPQFTRTFMNAKNMTNLPSNLFSGLTGQYIGNMFTYTFNRCSKMTGTLINNFFGNIRVTSLRTAFSFVFNNCVSLESEIPPRLFGTINGTAAWSMFRYAFNNCRKLYGSIPSGLFGTITGTPGGYDFQNAFAGCSNLTGTIPDGLFGNLSGAPGEYSFSTVFYGCSKLVGYIPSNLFGSMTAPASGTYRPLYGIFLDSGIATTCPCGTHQYTTGFESYFSGKVSCEIGVKDNEHWYGNQCVTDCDASVPGTSDKIKKLHVGNDYSFPILAQKVTNPVLNFGANGTALCYAPLESGAGGAGSLNFRDASGNVYHIGTVTSTPPVGWDPLAPAAN